MLSNAFLYAPRTVANVLQSGSSLPTVFSISCNKSLDRSKCAVIFNSAFSRFSCWSRSFKFYVRAELPGIKADAIDIQVVGRNLTITGERKIPSEGENIRYHRKEREAGKFSRIIGLPGDIDESNVEAKIVNGVLTVAIAKSEASKPKKITLN